MFLLNRLYSTDRDERDRYLHPIMFLLNLWWEDAENYKYLNLHPIMFLLNRKSYTVSCKSLQEFTSHYVPIKSITPLTAKAMLYLFTSHYVPIKSHTNIILYFLPFSTHFLSTTAKTSQADVRNLLNYLLTTLLTPHESMDCQLPHKNALS